MNRGDSTLLETVEIVLRFDLVTKRIMISVGKENCRTCLSNFTEKNEKCSLMDCSAINSDSSRLELMKNVMNSCSVTLFSNGNQETTEVFICSSCVTEIDQMLDFLQKCVHSEAILKQAFQVKSEINSIWVDDNQCIENGSQSKLEIKTENSDGGLEVNGFESDSESPNSLSEPSCEKDSKEEYLDSQKGFPLSLLPLTFQKYKSSNFKPHICVICHKNFQSLQLIKKHMAAEHENVSYHCRQCSEMFSSKYHLGLHELKVHGSKKYSCGVCKRTFATVSSLKFHENIHTKQQPYSCTSCSKTFVSASVLREHKNSFHSEVKSFKCHCGRSFNRKKKLELHVESVHENKDKIRKYSCPDCDKKFHHPYSLKNHLNTHLGVKPFLCNACGSAFTALSNLTSHLRRIHSGDKQPAVKKYLCHTCGDSFARAAHLQRHTLRKHVPNAEKKHECPICKKKFLEKSDVTVHIKLHDDVKPFECDQCSKCFRTGWRLQAHIKRVHLGLRPFECLTCALRFKTKSHLEKHIRTHTGEKPFPCPHCSYTCAEKSNLKKHINIHLKAM